jgi:hypothetical protein
MLIYLVKIAQDFDASEVDLDQIYESLDSHIDTDVLTKGKGVKAKGKKAEKEKGEEEEKEADEEEKEVKEEENPDVKEEPVSVEDP